jgi:hypothetical protein
VSVIDFNTRAVVATPFGRRQPDMGNVTADGTNCGWRLA